MIGYLQGSILSGTILLSWIKTNESIEMGLVMRKTIISSLLLLSLSLIFSLAVYSAEKNKNSSLDRKTNAFTIRGTLPWHNFLSGPSAWNEDDYRRYLDQMQSLGLNLVTFHCYTGGLQRYAPYVEPMIHIEYRDVVPNAFLDTSLSARWGYRPLKVKDFPFDTKRLFPLPAGAEAFGADSALLAKDNDDRYRRTQDLMKKVQQMSNERGIAFGMGFEFGIYPPEFASILPQDYALPGIGLPDPCHPSSKEILYKTIDNILETYPGIDWIWLWVHEHSHFVNEYKPAGSFAQFCKEENRWFADASESVKFNGLWSLAYIQQAYAYIQKKSPKTRIMISGWENGHFAEILQGLNKALPKDIAFSCLSPYQGAKPQPFALAEIVKDRCTIAIPWLEGDQRLWHLQPRVDILRNQIKLAQKQNLDGVVAIHWRTEEPRLNLETFARFAKNPKDSITTKQIYLNDCKEQYGSAAAKVLAPLLTNLDLEQTLNEPVSPVYFPYDPSWGRISEKNRDHLNSLIQTIAGLVDKTKNEWQRNNLNWLADKFRFTILLGEVSRNLEPAYKLKERFYSSSTTQQEITKDQNQATSDSSKITGDALQKASDALHKAPLEDLIKTFARTVRSQGERGELSSINQRVYLEYKELEEFLKSMKDK